MLNISEMNSYNTFTNEEAKQFLKTIKGHKYECFFKLIMTYQISRIELVCLEWKDIDFENNTITIYSIEQERINKVYYKWKLNKKENLCRTYPLLPHIKNLLLDLKFKNENDSLTNENYEFSNQNYICLKEDGTRLNYNTLSRNLRYIGRDNNLPQIYLDSLRICLDDFIRNNCNSYEYYRAWTRFDLHKKNAINIFENVRLDRNKKFINKLNNLISSCEHRRKLDFEM